MSKDDLKTSIQTILKEFGAQSLKQSATALLNTLGYSSDKTIELDGTPAAFLDQFNQNPHLFAEIRGKKHT